MLSIVELTSDIQWNTQTHANVCLQSEYCILFELQLATTVLHIVLYLLCPNITKVIIKCDFCSFCQAGKASEVMSISSSVTQKEYVHIHISLKTQNQDINQAYLEYDVHMEHGYLCPCYVWLSLNLPPPESFSHFCYLSDGNG